jgi:hypothetical protein
MITKSPNNQITDSGASALATALEKNTVLKDLK